MENLKKEWKNISESYFQNRKEIRMSKIGLYGGSFNPPTKAHIELAKKVIYECKLDKIIFVPVGDLYKKQGLAKGIHRYNMLQIACKKEKNLQVSNIEIRETKNYKTIEIFEILRNEYNNEDIYFIIGADNLYKMPSWENLEKLATYKYIIIKRNTLDCNKLINSNEILKKHKNNFNIIQNNEHNTDSATKVRQIIQSENIKILEQYINIKVIEYIKENELYV